MLTLADLKGAEVKLRNSRLKEVAPDYKKDIEWAHRFTKARRQKTEARLGIGELGN